jgi:fructose-1,6-bisphosphatase/inositol monophosphatase family enzyme
MAINPHAARQLLLQLGDSVRNKLVQARLAASESGDALAKISRESAADTIYEIDRISEEAIVSWFAEHWPKNVPIELVMEGVEPNEPVTIPHGTPVEQTIYKCILDPIDGTRGIMYDKRAAWFLAGLAPQKGEATRLSDIEVAAMVELPTTKQWRADRIAAIRGQGAVADSVNVLTHEEKPVILRPSRATNALHGFAYISRFFPTGKRLTAGIEQELWDTLHPSDGGRDSIIFEDQYICTGGQFYEILSGHDRMIADIRPLVFAKLGIESALCCHPYDVCSSLILSELGVLIEHPLGGSLDGPLDTTSPIAWVAYANEALASNIRPVFQKILQEQLNG